MLEKYTWDICLRNILENYTSEINLSEFTWESGHSMAKVMRAGNRSVTKEWQIAIQPCLAAQLYLFKEYMWLHIDIDIDIDYIFCVRSECTIFAKMFNLSIKLRSMWICLQVTDLFFSLDKCEVCIVYYIPLIHDTLCNVCYSQIILSHRSVSKEWQITIQATSF